MSNIVVVPHKINLNCTFAFYFLKQNLFKKPIKKEIFSQAIIANRYDSVLDDVKDKVDREQGFTKVPFVENSYNYCKVIFSGEYGSITNRPIRVM